MILIVGSNHYNTSEYYKKLNFNNSVLFTGTFTDATVYHSSLADCASLLKYVPQFDNVYWAESDPGEFNNYHEWFDCVSKLKAFNVKNLPRDPYNLHQTYTFTNHPNSAVFLGCSHTEGVGLADPNDNYVKYVSRHFLQQPLNLALGGRGNFRSFNIFRQIDFYPEQLVVLQLTDIGRIRYFNNDNFDTALTESQMVNVKRRSYFDVYNDKQLLFETLEHLEYTVKLAKLLNLRFVFFNLGGNTLGDNSEENNQLRSLTEYYLSDYREYIPSVLKQNVDRGTDGLHFGPNSHQIWANLVIKKIKEIY